MLCSRSRTAAFVCSRPAMCSRAAATGVRLGVRAVRGCDFRNDPRLRRHADSGVEVVLLQAPGPVHSDSRWRLSLAELPAGKRQLHFRRLGFAPKSSTRRSPKEGLSRSTSCSKPVRPRSKA